jgi:hypothetical protein
VLPADTALVKGAKDIFPPWTAILDSAWVQSEGDLTPRYVRENFSESVIRLNAKAYGIFQGYETKAFPNLIVKWMEAHGSEVERLHKEGVSRSLDGKESLGEVLREVVNKVVNQSFPTIRTFQTSVAQMKKKRGGETFQESIRRLLIHVGISCEKAKGSMEAELAHTDLVVPDIKTAIDYPDRAIFMACQHTLAERWWAATPMAASGKRGYIITLETRLGKDKAERMKKFHLVAYVPDAVKAKDTLKGMNWIRALSDLPRDLKSTSER